MLCPILNTLEKGFIISVLFCILVPFKVNSACPDNLKSVCPCGQKGKSFVTLCVSGNDDDPCEKLSLCETCSEESRACFTCPPGRFGRYCENVHINGWNNVSSNSIGGTLPHKKIRAKKAVSCPDIRGPKLGSIKCWYSRNERECTGRCLPGHSFENRENEEIVLKCIGGRWMPMSSFPPCKSEGHCDLEMAGAGSYNCTTGSRGTFCDIRCTGRRWINNRFFCYPGQPWEPPLPYCIRMKYVQPPPVECKCQNGGSCVYDGGLCECVENFTGRFCEDYLHVEKARCSDPGLIPNGERINAEGRSPSRNQLYEEGSSVIFSCRAGYALVGHSLLTCQSGRMWSSKLPNCQKIQVATTTTTETYVEKARCSDPGFIANGERINAQGRSPSRNQLYEEGSSVIFSCRAGYALVGHSLLTCQSGRMWSSKLPNCQKIQVATTTTTEKPKAKIFCPDPGLIANGDRWTMEGRASSRGDIFEKGKSVVYSCRSGYALQGLTILTCLPSRQWSNMLPECKKVQGPLPPNVTPEDGSDEIAYCEDPGKDPNSARTEDPWIDAKKKNPISKEEFPQGFRLRYKCKNGYVLEGDSAILCLFTGVWSAPIPKCLPGSGTQDNLAYCPDPGDIENGRRVVNFSLNKRKVPEEPYREYPEGVQIQYFCFEGFELLGDNIIRCMSNGDWNELPPDCLVKEYD